MNMNTATCQFRISNDEKQKTFEVFDNLGISPSQALRLFFAQVRRTKSIPFSIDYEPNKKAANYLLNNKEYSK